jgi:Rad3-related DNA helicase
MNDDVCSTVARLVERVPGGVLIFFPSYKLLNDMYNHWESSRGL